MEYLLLQEQFLPLKTFQLVHVHFFQQSEHLRFFYMSSAARFLNGERVKVKEKVLDDVTLSH